MPEIQIPSFVITGLQVILAFVGAFAVALWISLIVWTFRDARARSRDIFAVLLATLMVTIFGPLGLIIYFLLRPRTTLAELYERSLEEEALLQDLEERSRCAGCSRQVNDSWIVCPDCHTTLRKVCPSCGNSLNLAWSLCPYCATQVEVPTDHSDHSDSSGRAELATQPMAPVASPVSEPEAEPVFEDSEPEPVSVVERPSPSRRGDETQPQLPQAGPA